MAKRTPDTATDSPLHRIILAGGTDAGKRLVAIARANLKKNSENPSGNLGRSLSVKVRIKGNLIVVKIGHKTRYGGLINFGGRAKRRNGVAVYKPKPYLNSDIANPLLPALEANIRADIEREIERSLRG